MRTPTLLDRWGRPVERSTLAEEVAAPTLTGVRSPVTGYPGDGLNPLRLAAILRDADAGDPIRYLELAETIEERDLHYLGVLGTRRRSVSQIEVSVEAASDTAADVRIADTIRDWLRRDELAEELFDILDCIGKGYSFTEIIWDRSAGQWQPARLEWRDPRWFRFERRDLATPLLIGEGGADQPLPPFKFIFAQIKAKSGLALRSGLARAGAWAWMFKAFTQRDWAIFTQTYGQPLRLGKFGADATEADKQILYRAVANIAGDCAAIIPEGMQIEFIETGSVGQTAELYERRADWLDRQISKAVLGQTATTDAVTGGLGSGTEHRQVQEDIERADARALSAILNRDLIRPWVDLEFGPQERYPRLVIARPEKEDLKGLVEAVASLVPLGLRVKQSEMRDRLGLSDPGAEAELLGAPVPAPQPLPAPVPDPAAAVAPQSAGPATNPPTAADLLTDALADRAAPLMGDMIATVEAMLDAAGSLDEFRLMLREAFPPLDAGPLTAAMAEAFLATHLAGRADVEDEVPDDLSGVLRLPFAEQIAALRLRFADLRPTARWDDLVGAQHDRAFMVAGAVKADLLADLAAAVDRAVSEGTTLEAFRADFRAIVERHGWHGWTGEGTKRGEAWRTRVIYRTNIATTYAAGRLAQLRAAGFTHWVYRHSGAEHPRLDHLSWDGLVLPSTHDFWKTHYPPNGWGCGCYVLGARSDRGARRLGGDPSKPLPPGWDRTDPKTGTPPGIGKGWDHAPGDSVSDLVSVAARKLSDLDVRIAVDFGSAIREPIARAWVDWVGDVRNGSRHDPGLLGTLDAEDFALLEARGIAPRSAAIMVKPGLVSGPKARRHEAKGDALADEDWRALAMAIRQPLAVCLDARSGNLLYVLLGTARHPQIVVEIDYYAKIDGTLSVTNMVVSAHQVTLQNLLGRLKGGELQLLRGTLSGTDGSVG